jgi:hypothetical protein
LNCHDDGLRRCLKPADVQSSTRRRSPIHRRRWDR